jgi:Tat protein translocase TatB subunit
MNVFSNIGITELIFILLLALLVVGPERLPEMGRKLGQILRDVRRAYENLTRDIGPELTSIQRTTQELRESVDSIRSIPRDMVDSVVKAADLDDTLDELKEAADSVGQVGQTLTTARRAIKDPVKTATRAVRDSLTPADSTETVEADEKEDSETASPAEESAHE